MAVLTREAAAARGDELALVDDEGVRSWAQLDSRVNRLVHAFRGAGLGQGDTISVVAGNRNEWFEVALACSHAGIVYVPVNWHLVATEMAHIIEDSGSSAVLAGHHFTDVVAEALVDPRSSAVELAIAIGAPGDDRFTDFETFLGSGSDAEPAEQAFGGPMFYTSGTTGHPRGVRGSLASAEPDTPPEVWQLVAGGFTNLMTLPGTAVLCGPFYHSAQWAFSFLPMVGGSAVVMQHRYDSAGVLDLIDTHGGTSIHLVPTQMKRLLDLDEDRRTAFNGSSLEIVFHGAAPCPPVVKRGLIDWWGPKIVEYYGSTEGSIITMIDSLEWLERGGSVGKPMPNMEILVLGDDGESKPTGDEGTLYFRSAMGMDFEYHNAPEKTAEAHRGPGVFTTGDVGYLDEDGYLWLSDRKIDMIISGGVNVYPAEIEGVIGGHPDVADVAVIGVPNEEFGEEVKALVVPGEGVDPAGDLAARLTVLCREQLAGFKVPRSVEFRESLPRTGTGKVQKRLLREPFWAGHDRRI